MNRPWSGSLRDRSDRHDAAALITALRDRRVTVTEEMVSRGADALERLYKGPDRANEPFYLMARAVLEAALTEPAETVREAYTAEHGLRRVRDIAIQSEAAPFCMGPAVCRRRPELLYTEPWFSPAPPCSSPGSPTMRGCPPGSSGASPRPWPRAFVRSDPAALPAARPSSAPRTPANERDFR